jgi:3-hydroxybutyryl-CoA dehydrogenase
MPPAVRGLQARLTSLSYREVVHEPHGTDDLAGAVIGVVGAGTMGAGIAQVALEAGHEVILYDVDEQALEGGVERVRLGLGRRAAKLELDADSIDEWVDGRLANLRTAVTLDSVGAAADIAIEAAIEDIDLKQTIFRVLDREAPPDALLATNTSALSVAAIAIATSRPEHVLGLHFFNPAPLMPLVEVVRGPQTDGDSVKRAVALTERWGKTPVVAEDAPGFIVNRVNRPFTLEALAMLEAGEASIPVIDAAVRGAGYPMGPFELMDLTGVDVSLAAARGIHDGFVARGDPLADRFRPSELQERLVEAGRVGRKAGAGFYAYDAELAADLPEVAGTVETDPAAASVGSLEPVTRDRIVERIELAIANEAYRARDEGVAGQEDIDRALRLGAGHPAGPFERWIDRGGADAIRERLRAYADQGPRFEPAPGLGESI